MENDVLAIFGERTFEKEEKGKKHHRVERAYRSFVCSFGFPEDADGSRVSADSKDGVLQVQLPRSQKAKPKAIEIKAGECCVHRMMRDVREGVLTPTRG